MPARPLIPGALAFSCGIGLGNRCDYFPVTVSLITLGILVLLFRLRSRIGGDAGQSRMGTGVLCGLLLFGLFYYQWKNQVAGNDISHWATGEQIIVVGRVDEPVKYYPRKVVIHLTALAVWEDRGNDPLAPAESQAVSGRIRLSVYEPETALSYGDLIRFQGSLKPIRSFQNPGGFDYARYMAWQGIRTSAGVSRTDAVSKIGVGGNPPLKRILAWRESIRRSMNRSLSPSSSAILQAMVVGTTGGLTPEIRDAFMAAGVTHILSISGSHLGMLAFGIFTLSRFLLLHLPAGLLLRLTVFGPPSKIAALLAIPPVTFYAFLAGAEVATLRSWVMVLIFLTALLLERESEVIHSLAAAALVVLIHDPRALFDISFQLSYVAVLAMGLVIAQDRRRSLDEPGTTIGKRPIPGQAGTKLYFLKTWLYKRGRLYLQFTLAASLSTVPLVAFYFQQVSWVGLISNGVIVPWVGGVMVPLGLLSAGLSLFSPSGILPFAVLNDFAVNVLRRFVSAFASLPWAEFHIASPTYLEIILFYAVLLSLVYCGKRRGKWGMIAVLTIFCLVLWKPGIKTSGGASAVRVTYMDVGQGDSAVVQSEGKVMVIDGGGTFSDSFDTGRSVVAPYLWNQGIRRIDTLVATHPQLDHMEGLLYLIDHFPVGEAWINGDPGGGRLGRVFDSRIHDKGVSSRVISIKDDEQAFGNCRLDFLNPPAEEREGRRIGVNDRSIAFRIQCDRVSFLFTGDIERAGIQNMMTQGKSLESTVLKVPHHGGRSSVNGEFVSRVCPQFAVFSAGYKNRFHHPSPEALSAYRNVGAKIFRTDASGALVVDWDGRNLRFRTGNDMNHRTVKRWGLMSMWSEELGNYKRAIQE